MLQKIRNYLEWGVKNLDEIIVDKKIFDFFYNSDLWDIRNWNV